MPGPHKGCGHIFNVDGTLTCCVHGLCVHGMHMVCAQTLLNFYPGPPTPPHTHAMPTQPHTPPPHAGAAGAITAAAECPSTLRGMRHRQPAPLVPLHPPLPPPLPHTTCAAVCTAAPEPTAAARAALHASPLLPLLPVLPAAAAVACCRCICTCWPITVTVYGLLQKDFTIPIINSPT